MNWVRILRAAGENILCNVRDAFRANRANRPSAPRAPLARRKFISLPSSELRRVARCPARCGQGEGSYAHPSTPTCVSPVHHNENHRMKTIASPFRSTRNLCVAGLTLGLTTLFTPLSAQEPVTGAAKAGDKAANKAEDRVNDYRTDPSELNKAEVKSALQQIDAELDHLDRLADNAPTEADKAAAKARYAALKQRRDDLQKNFTRARYDAFKADVRAEWDKASRWSKDTFTNKPAANESVRSVTDRVDATEHKITDYRADATDLNKAEVKAALSRLDVDIQLLESRISAVSDSQRRAELTAKLNSYKERRDDLQKDFRQARFQALVDEVKAEWDKLTN
jgi:hypothetical protein